MISYWVAFIRITIDSSKLPILSCWKEPSFHATTMLGVAVSADHRIFFHKVSSSLTWLLTKSRCAICLPFSGVVSGKPLPQRGQSVMSGRIGFPLASFPQFSQRALQLCITAGLLGTYLTIALLVRELFLVGQPGLGSARVVPYFLHFC